MKRLTGLLLIAISGATTSRGAATPTAPPATIVAMVQEIRRADYENDRPTLKDLSQKLTAATDDPHLASRIYYWRGFALWRKAINGFNDRVPPTDLEDDLKQALVEFKMANEKDPAFVDAKAGSISCLGLLMFVNQKDQTQAQAWLMQLLPLAKEAKELDPNNPRLLWVSGQSAWALPVDRGGGQAKAMEIYERGLKTIRDNKSASQEPLEPSWGEPELLMNLAWSNLNKTSPDLAAADANARAALAIVPKWHYVRDILLPQIEAARAKQKGS